MLPPTRLYKASLSGSGNGVSTTLPEVSRRSCPDCADDTCHAGAVTQPVLFGGPAPGQDPELDLVTAHLYTLDPSGNRVAAVLRETLDQLLDGRRSGRWDYAQLHKTEKTHMGTLVEINFHREFDFVDGDATDYRIGGVEVDCKFSQVIGGWEIGPEIVGHLCLVIWARDSASRWQAGLVRATADRLRTATNRDAKRRLTPTATADVRWLWPDHGRLQENTLLHLEPGVRAAIMRAQGANGRHGQARLFALCRLVQGRILNRTLIETVGWGLDDPLKRMRSNGGARDALRPEGLLVLGHHGSDQRIADELGLPTPVRGEFLSVRVAPARQGDLRPTTLIAGGRWVAAEADDPIAAAPDLR